MRRFSLTICFIIVFGAFGGCAPRRMEQLDKRIQAYWNGMRWRSAGSVAQLVESEARPQYLNQLTAKLDKIRVVDFNVMNVNVAPDKKMATTIVNYSYYALDENDLRNQQELQQWHYTNADGWLLRIPKSEKKTVTPSPQQ